MSQSWITFNRNCLLILVWYLCVSAYGFSALGSVRFSQCISDFFSIFRIELSKSQILAKQKWIRTKKKTTWTIDIRNDLWIGLIENCDCELQLEVVACKNLHTFFDIYECSNIEQSNLLLSPNIWLLPKTYISHTNTHIISNFNATAHQSRTEKESNVKCRELIVEPYESDHKHTRSVYRQQIRIFIIVAITRA